VIAIDGKTVRRSGHKRSGKAAIHMVSAFAAGQRLELGQVKMAEKSNEIIAIPKLLDLLAHHPGARALRRLPDQGAGLLQAHRGNPEAAEKERHTARQ
jgi:hypothetical protein